MIITIQHMRQAKYCLSGVKRFCEQHNLDWRKLVKEGLPEEEFLNTKDVMAKRVVEIANGLK